MTTTRTGGALETGGVDVWVNNAGVLLTGPAWEQTDDQRRLMRDVNAASEHAVMGFSSSTAADLRLAGVDDIDISCICPDGIWTPMLVDKLEDPQAALSFSGVLLQPADVVRAVGRVLESPRPVTAVPTRRGALARMGAAFPRLASALLPLIAAKGRRKQLTLLRTQGLSRP